MKKKLILLFCLALTLSACDDKAQIEPKKLDVEIKVIQKDEVPEITVNAERTKLFVAGKEMLPKDFLDKYCFAKRDAKCQEVQIMKRINDLSTPAKKLTNW